LNDEQIESALSGVAIALFLFAVFYVLPVLL
jgi:hypothetical protein